MAKHFSFFARYNNPAQKPQIMSWQMKNSKMKWRKLKVLAGSADNENHMLTTSSTAAVLLLSTATLTL